MSFTAYEIDVPKLLADVKEYIKSKPKHLEWRKLDVSNIGYRLVAREPEAVRRQAGRDSGTWTSSPGRATSTSGSP